MSTHTARAIAGTRLLTPEEAAERIGYSVHTLRKWVKRKMCGFPPPVKLGAKRLWRFREWELDAWIEMSARTPAPKRLVGIVKKKQDELEALKAKQREARHV